MVKCDMCDKGITKRNPGLECSKCGKAVHTNQLCSGLSTKQVSALRNSECLGWTCDECNHSTPHRKSSFIAPDEDEEETEEAFVQGIGMNTTIDTKKLLRDISMEMKKVMRKETEVIEGSINCFGKKVDDLSAKMELFGEKFNEMERKQIHLANNNKHLEIRMSSLEIRMRKMEQDALENKVELAGIPQTKDEDLNTIACNVAKLLAVNEKTIKNVKRADGRAGSDAPILVELTEPELAAVWARASKKETNPILAEHVVPRVPKEAAKSKVFVRRALTKSNKALLWNAQQKLRPTFKYVWFQGGKVLVRKDDNEKPIAIWCEEDIAQITK